MNLLVRFLLVLVMLLAGRHTDSSAFTSKSYITYPPATLAGKFHNKVSSLAVKQVIIIRTNLYETKEEKTEISATGNSEEDNDDSSSKKIIRASGAATLFSAGIPHLFSQPIQRFSYNKHFSYLSSLRFLLLRVIRI